MRKSLKINYKSYTTVKPPYVEPYPVAPTGTWICVAGAP